MSGSGKRKNYSFVVGAAVPDPFAQFVFNMAPHPGTLGRKSKPAEKKGVVGSGLQLGTAGTLFAESAVRATSLAGQAGIGFAQRNIGVFGALYYGQKAWKEGGATNYAKTAAYSTFAAHGIARMFYPQALFTPASGAMAAVLKSVSSGPFSFPGFVADLAANVVEMAHVVHKQHHGHPPRGGWKKAAYALAEQVGHGDLKAIQRFGGRALALSATYELIKETRKHY